MTEMASGEVQNSNFAPEPVTHSPAPAASEAERTFRQSEVNDLVGRAKSEAVERYKRDTSVASHSQPQNQQQYAPQHQQLQHAQPPNQAISHDDYRQMAAEEAQKLYDKKIQDTARDAQERDAQRIASEFFTKVEAGKANYEDFDKVMGDVDLRTIPYHVQLANMVDNTADVMYELAKNPSKIGAIQNLIDIDLRAGRQPKLAMTEMKRMSQQIKDNAAGAKFKAPNEPLSQLRPSNAGTDNKGALTVGDYKAKYRI